MPRGISRLLRHRQGSAPVLLVFLLAMAGVAGDTAIMSTLRGYPVKDDANAAPTLGYYEALINSPTHQVSDDAPHPPPGWLPFGGDVTGIVKELPTYLRWEMKPNLDILWNGTTFQTNRLGFRTPEVSLEKPAGTYRILVFGSSNTMGYGVDNNDMYTRHLEQFLDAWTGPSQRVEVVNLAVAGDSPTRRLERMKKEAGRWNADWLLCDASVLDSWLEDNHVHTVLQRGLPIPFPFVEEAIRRSVRRRPTRWRFFATSFAARRSNYLRVCMRPGAAEAARLRIPLSVVILPRGDSKARSSRAFPVDSVALRAERARLHRHVERVRSDGRRRVPHLRLGQTSQRPRPSRHFRGLARRDPQRWPAPRALASDRRPRRAPIIGEHGSLAQTRSCSALLGVRSSLTSLPGKIAELAQDMTERVGSSKSDPGAS